MTANVHLGTGETIVYRATNTVTGDFYIGCTRNGLAAREYQHRNAASHAGRTKLHRAIREFGQDVFVFEQLFDFEDDHDLALMYEAEMIARHAPAYNAAPGGRRKMATEETPEQKRRRTRKPVQCVNDGKIFDCARSAAAFYGLIPHAVAAVAKGERYRKSVHGLKFIYVVKQ